MLLSVSNSITHTATISRLNFLLGALYADAIHETCRRKRVPIGSIELCGLHGQTIFHEGQAVEYLGMRVASTLQIGEAAVVAERTGIHTISNFRERDIAAGGRGAPLVPYVDYLLFRHRRTGRIALNIGGIANITVIPAGAQAHRRRRVRYWARQHDYRHLSGAQNPRAPALRSRWAHREKASKIHPRMLEAMLSDPYFTLDPPKSAGREQFGHEFASGLIATGLPIDDLIATATEFTAQSIARAIRRAVARESAKVIASGRRHP